MRIAVMAEVNFGLVDIEPVSEREDDLRLRVALCDVNGKAKVSKDLLLSGLRWPAEENT